MSDANERMDPVELAAIAMWIEDGRTPPDELMHRLAAALRRVSEGEDPRKMFPRGRRGRPGMSLTEARPKIACVVRVLDLKEQGDTHEDAIAKAAEEYGHPEDTVRDWIKKRHVVRRFVDMMNSSQGE